MQGMTAPDPDAWVYPGFVASALDTGFGVGARGSVGPCPAFAARGGGRRKKAAAEGR